eukprot:12888170-Alexandrium_andersonii.AAC.1
MHAERFQTAFLEQRPPVMLPDMALSNVIQYGSPEQVQERVVTRPKTNEMAQSVIGQLKNVTA